MIIINGLIGVAMLLGGFRWGEQEYNLKSSTAFFSMILVLAAVGLYLPMVVPQTSRVAYYVFLVALFSLLYLLFLRIQTSEHRYFFISKARGSGPHHHHDAGGPGWYHGAFLLLTLALIAYLAESTAALLDVGVERFGAPPEAASLLVALLILAPEGLTALRAGLDNDMQRVVNICLGSALSTVSLTIPAVLLVGFVAHHPIVLALTPVQAVMLGFSLMIGMTSYRSGETNLLQGAIHFGLFATFIALIFL
jgi:Ca2+:H+ antiporter